MLAFENHEHHEYGEQHVPTEQALHLVTSQNGEGVYASADVLFKGAVFGRDSLKVGRDLLEIRPHLTKEILVTLAAYQGTEDNPINEEQPGKIMHEMRRQKDLDETSAVIFDELTSPDAKNWGKEWDEQQGCWRMVYFGSVDATPSYVQLLSEYCDRYGADLLDEQIKRRDGSTVSLAETMQNAVTWITDQLDQSPSGLLSYKRVNLNGIENQVWKDSKEFYVHADGSFVNHDSPVASIEVQGYAYDALQNASRYLPHRREELQQRAEGLRTRTLELLWDADSAYFHVGIDQTDDGSLRTIHTKAANAACLLDSQFFDTLPEEDRRLYISAIVRTVTSPDFLTDAGIRSRALSDAKLVPFWDYHGSHVSWPKETYDVIRGLYRQGFTALAEQLQNRMLNAVHRSGAFPEFMYVDDQGQALLEQDQEGTPIDSTNKPEAIQAWTVSSVMAAMANQLYGSVDHDGQEDWTAEIEAEILDTIPDMPFYHNEESLAERYPSKPYRLVKRRSLTSSNFLHEKVA